MNVVLCRVLNAHALVAAPQLSLGRLHGVANLPQPALLEWTRDGAMTYAWPYQDSAVWEPRKSFIQRQRGCFRPNVVAVLLAAPSVDRG